MNFPWDQTSGTFSVDVLDIVETSENTATALNILLIEEVRQLYENINKRQLMNSAASTVHSLNSKVKVCASLFLLHF